MILPAQVIRQFCYPSDERVRAHPAFAPMVSPFAERTAHEGMTYGLGPAGYDIRLAEDHELARTSHTYLASSMERFAMPPDVLGVVHDKSTWARVGLTVQNTVIEPGWRGFLTLELVWFPLSTSPPKHGPLALRRGDPIAQIVFHRLEAATEIPYEGKYNDQKAGPQGAIFE